MRCSNILHDLINAEEILKILVIRLGFLSQVKRFRLEGVRAQGLRVQTSLSSIYHSAGRVVYCCNSYLVRVWVFHKYGAHNRPQDTTIFIVGASTEGALNCWKLPDGQVTLSAARETVVRITVLPSA